MEQVYTIFNTAHPAGYCGRSLSVGDVVKLENAYYLCVPIGFQQVTFQASPSHPMEKRYLRTAVNLWRCWSIAPIAARKNF